MVPAWLGVSALARAAAPVRLILDTDMGGGACRDVDDVVALCTLHAMMDNGEVRSRTTVPAGSGRRLRRAPRGAHVTQRS